MISRTRVNNASRYWKTLHIYPAANKAQVHIVWRVRNVGLDERLHRSLYWLWLFVIQSSILCFEECISIYNGKNVLFCSFIHSVSQRVWTFIHLFSQSVIHLFVWSLICLLIHPFFVFHFAFLTFQPFQYTIHLSFLYCF